MLALLAAGAGACARTPARPETKSKGASDSCDMGSAPLVTRSYTPPLFSRGDDATSAPDCTHPNPERGFFAFRDLLAPEDLDELRGDGVSLAYAQAILADYRDRPLDDRALARVQAGFAAARRAGIKLLPRFYYAADDKAPDAKPARALEHIAALAPLLRENADVIAALHAGFVGAWGEWHPDERATMAERQKILEALLAALPEDRMVMVRRPIYKRTPFGGPLTAALAFATTPLARVGHVNDCFLASSNDFGTYRAPGEEAYATSDAAFVAVGGETCAPNPPRSQCASALDALARHHFSFLNREYHEAVLASWRDDGCLPTIRCRLGYRLALHAFTLPAQLPRGAAFAARVSLGNDGWARPYNPRPIALAFAPLDQSGQRGPIHRAVSSIDARSLAPGGPQDLCLSVPLDLPPGRYVVGLSLADASPKLAIDPRYAVRLAGDVSYEDATGVNWLDAVVTIAP